MKRKLFNLFVAAALAVGLVGSQASSVFAGDTTNLAGRPISGGFDSGIGGGNCQGIAYGRVAGAFVLFVANHCRLDKPGCVWNAGAGGCVNTMDETGDTVYGPNGQAIGTWGPFTVGMVHDLTYININSTSHPSNANQIFRGPVSGATDWWTMTSQPSSTMEACDGGWLNYGMAQMAQPTSGALTTLYTSRQDYFSGFATGPSGSGTTRHCTIQTPNLTVRSGTYVESSSPVVRLANTARLFGHVTGGITVTPIYDGLHAFAVYLGSATLCTTASCP